MQWEMQWGYQRKEDQADRLRIVFKDTNLDEKSKGKYKHLIVMVIRSHNLSILHLHQIVAVIDSKINMLINNLNLSIKLHLLGCIETARLMAGPKRVEQ